MQLIVIRSQLIIKQIPHVWHLSFLGIQVIYKDIKRHKKTACKVRDKVNRIE